MDQWIDKPASNQQHRDSSNGSQGARVYRIMNSQELDSRFFRLFLEEKVHTNLKIELYVLDDDFANPQLVLSLSAPIEAVACAQCSNGTIQKFASKTNVDLRNALEGTNALIKCTAI